MKKYKVSFFVEVDMSPSEVDLIRKENRAFLTHGFFAKDENVEKIAAYNKAIEKIVRGEAPDYEIILLDKTKL